MIFIQHDVPSVCEISVVACEVVETIATSTHLACQWSCSRCYTVIPRADALGTHRWEIPSVKFIDLIWDLCYSESYCPHTSAVSYQLITTQTLIQTQNTVRTVKDGLVAIPTEPFGSPHIVF